MAVLLTGATVLLTEMAKRLPHPPQPKRFLMKRQFLFTSESVTEGHPDRICDSIADALVDRFLQQDPYSRVVTECAISKGIVFIAARLASLASVDLRDGVRSVIARIGYQPEDFNVDDCTGVTRLTNMSLDQRPRVDEEELSEAKLDRLFVNNPTTVFGFACNQTSPNLCPCPSCLPTGWHRDSPRNVGAA